MKLFYQIGLSVIIAVAIFLLFFYYNRSKSNDIQNNTNQKQIESVKNIEDWSKCDSIPTIKYSLYKIKDKDDLIRIKNKFELKPENKIKYRAITTLNRKELRFMHVGDNIIIPDSFVEDLRTYSIFPHCYKGAKDIPKIVIVSNQYQCYACYEYGKLVRFAAANTGKEKTPTFPGRYALVWKSLERRSSLDSNWKMPYTYNFHKYAGNAFHQFTMPGRAVSHSCIRQFMDDAKWLYSWGEGTKYNENKKPIPYSGTCVIITGIFDFSRKRGGPWLELSSNKDKFLDVPDKPMEVEEALIPWVQIPKESKSIIPNRKRYINAEDTLRARGIIRSGVVLTQTTNFNKIRQEKARKQKNKEQNAKEQKVLIKDE